MIYDYAKKLLYLGISIYSFVVCSQSSNDDEIYNAFDEIIGVENTLFFNGPEFKDEYPNASGDSRYFNRKSFAKSSIAYNGQWYSNAPLSYDIFSDNVITRSNDQSSSFIVRLIPEYITDFRINGHHFIRLQELNLGIDANSFYEVILNGNSFELYIKHVRRKKERTVGYEVEHSFSNENYYVVKSEDAYTKVNSVKDFKAVVPDRYKEVQRFRKDYKTLYKADTDGFMIKLIEHLNGF